VRTLLSTGAVSIVATSKCVFTRSGFHGITVPARLPLHVIAGMPVLAIAQSPALNRQWLKGRLTLREDGGSFLCVWNGGKLYTGIRASGWALRLSRNAAPEANTQLLQGSQRHVLAGLFQPVQRGNGHAQLSGELTLA